MAAVGNVPGSRVQLESLHADDGQSPNAGNRLSWTAYDYDASGRVAVRRSSDGGRTDTGYYPCGLVRTTLDDAGLAVTNRLDALGQTVGRDGRIYAVQLTQPEQARKLLGVPVIVLPRGLANAVVALGVADQGVLDFRLHGSSDPGGPNTFNGFRRVYSDPIFAE